MQIQYLCAQGKIRYRLLFALNLVTLLMQIQYELNKLLIVNALQRCWKIKKNNKKVLPFKIKRELFYLEHFKLNVRSFDFLRLASEK